MLSGLITPINVRAFLSIYLEPISFLLYFGAFFFYSWRLVRKFHYRLLCSYYFVASVMMIKAVRLADNTQLYNLMYVLTSLSLGYYFYSLLQTRLKRAIAIVCGLAPLLYYLSRNTIFESELLFDSIGHAISSSGIVIMIFLYLHYVITNVKEEPLSHNFDFWFVCVQLFYHLGAFAIFLSYNYFTRKFLSVQFYSDENRSILTYLWVVHNVLLFLGALTTAYAILWIYRRKSPSS